MSSLHQKKSPLRKKATLSLFEFWILTMIGPGGVRTLYELQTKALVSTGATGPAVRRLQKLGLLERSADTRSRAKLLSITSAGKQELAGDLLRYSSAATDTDSRLRFAWAAHMLHRKDLAEQIVREGARKCGEEAQQLKDFAELDEVSGSAGMYWRLRMGVDIERLLAEARFLDEIKNLERWWKTQS